MQLTFIYGYSELPDTFVNGLISSCHSIQFQGVFNGFNGYLIYVCIFHYKWINTCLSCFFSCLTFLKGKNLVVASFSGCLTLFPSKHTWSLTSWKHTNTCWSCLFIEQKNYLVNRMQHKAIMHNVSWSFSVMHMHRKEETTFFLK